MANDFIKIRGARVNNLKNIDVDIPKNKLVVITGLSGSGKSSLAFDTLYAEGQRRYVESLSAYARQFLGVMDKPDVDKIEGISPAISIDQRRSTHNPRSTVGTMTEIYDYLRLLFVKVGKPHCPNCGKPIFRQDIAQIIEQVIKIGKNKEILILGPMVHSEKGSHDVVLEEIQRAGFVRVRIDGTIYLVEEAIEKQLDKQKKHNIEVVVDGLVLEKNLDKSRLADSLETALRLGKGIAMVNNLIFSERFACKNCDISLTELEPRMFSFNSPYGACSECTGLGEKLEVDPELVIPNKSLTLAEGAIWPWSNTPHKSGRQGYYHSKLLELSKKYMFSLDEEVKNLPKKIIDAILKEEVIPDLEKKYRETDSDWMRQEIEQYMVVKKCPKCLGKRLKPEVLAVTVADQSIAQISEMPIAQAKEFFETLSPKFSANELKVIQPVVEEITNRLQLLIDVGLGYLTLDRKAGTLAGGEEQRIRLATQIGSELSGVLYILDEPSIGLHPRDQQKLIDTLIKLKKIGNTVVVVEHDSQTMMASDWIIDIGPGAGKHGGNVVFQGTPKQLLNSKTLTGDYLSGRKSVSDVKYSSPNVKKEQKYLTIVGAKEHNLKNIDVKIPLAKFVCVTGVSGSGKSSLINDILAKSLLKKFYRAKDEPGEHKEILGIENLNKVVLVDQSPIGRTPRSNPATYTGAFSHIRDIFIKTKEAKLRGYSAGRFSFNVKGGRCEACEGQGQKKVEMYFLPDIYVDCQECQGKRYNKEVLEIEYKGKNIADVLEMTVEEATEFFEDIPGLYEKMKTLKEVGLSYIKLGQSAISVSGGEAQRIKLSTELSKKSAGKSLYILDEPTTGLHPHDIKKLVWVLKGLVEKGNTVVMIEHNVDCIKNADWCIDLGPEGGDKGGNIVAEGSPDMIKKSKKGYTFKYL